MASAASSSLELPTPQERQRAQALQRYRLLRPFLEDNVPLSHIATDHHVSLRTLRRWVTKYRAHGLAGLMRPARSDSGQRRSVPERLKQVIEGLALQKPRRTVAHIRREATRICEEQQWAPPSYS